MRVIFQRSPSGDKSVTLQKFEARPTELRMPSFHWPVPVFKRDKPKKPRCVEIEPRHLSLTDLEHGDCRYPYGGDEEGEAITFCGHPHGAGSSYCTPHFRLSRNPIPPSECLVSTVLRLVEAT